MLSTKGTRVNLVELGPKLSTYQLFKLVRAKFMDVAGRTLWPLITPFFLGCVNFAFKGGGKGGSD